MGPRIRVATQSTMDKQQWRGPVGYGDLAPFYCLHVHVRSDSKRRGSIVKPFHVLHPRLKPGIKVSAEASLLAVTLHKSVVKKKSVPFGVGSILALYSSDL